MKTLPLHELVVSRLYCLSCILFPSISQACRAEILISLPYKNWKKARADIANHSTLKYHLLSECKKQAFLDTCKGSQIRIDHYLTTESHKQVSKNRQFLKSIISCLEFCGRQGIALRGHRDNASSDNLSQGNFKALIQLRIDAGKVALETHLKECSKRFTYTSKTTQNELLYCIGEIFQREIVAEVHSHSDTTQAFFGIQADEVTDISNWEQLGIIVRYLKEKKVVERLLAFTDCESITGKSICEKNC